MTTDTLTKGAAQAAPASLFEQPVVHIFEAMRALRPSTPPPIYTPSLTVGNVALGALFEAIFESKPKLGDRTIENLCAALAMARSQEPGGDKEIMARSALEWLRDIRAMVQLRELEG